MQGAYPHVVGVTRSCTGVTTFLSRENRLNPTSQDRWFDEPAIYLLDVTRRARFARNRPGDVSTVNTPLCGCSPTRPRKVGR